MIIASIGDVGIDQYVNRTINRIGGIAFNYAVKSNPKEHNVYLMAPLGTKESEIVLKELENLNIQTDFIQIYKGNSPLQKITLLSDGTRNFCGYTEGVLAQYQLKKETIQFLENADIIHCPLTDGFESIFHEICDLSAKGLKTADISQDYEYYSDDLVGKYADNFDIIFLGGDILNMEMVATLAIKHNGTIFVLTMGEHGSIVYKGTESWKQPAFSAEKVDATGCGDTFQAVFTIEYLKSGDFAHSLAAAAKQATKTLSYVGIYERAVNGSGI